MKIKNMLLILVALAGIKNVHAQDKSNDTTARYFIIQASIANLHEIVTGKLAEKRAASPEVKAFAQRMIADHGKAQSQLMQLIQTNGYQVPPNATDTPVEDLKLKNTAAKDFDRMYVHMMVPGHRETVQLFQKYALMGKDPVAKAFAEQTLPVLKEHLAAIVAIDDKMKDVIAQ